MEQKSIIKSVAVIANYPLNPERIGGMDRFYWYFDKKCKDNGIEIAWYFPDQATYEGYAGLTIYNAEGRKTEDFFIDNITSKNIKYDVVITHFVELCTHFFKDIKAVYPSLIICVDHNPRPIEGFPIKKRIKNRLKGLLYAKYTNLFIGVSEYTKKQILNDYGTALESKTKVVYNGIDTGIFLKRNNKNTNRFYVASHLRYSKGIQDLLSAVMLLDEKTRKAIVIDIYGEGPLEEELRLFTEKHELTGIVNFMGSSPKLHELASNYSYMIQPTYMECFSLSILESLAANVPVITTWVGGNPEIIENEVNGFIFNPKDIAGLSEILKKIVSREISVTADVSQLIESRFDIHRMVDEHFNLL